MECSTLTELMACYSHVNFSTNVYQIVSVFKLQLLSCVSLVSMSGNIIQADGEQMLETGAETILSERSLTGIQEHMQLYRLPGQTRNKMPTGFRRKVKHFRKPNPEMIHALDIQQYF